MTRYRPLRRYGRHTLLAVEIPTGVTHQIRIQLAALGHAVVGDRLYAHNPDAAPRQFLHAVRLGFRHPQTTQWTEIISPRPAAFTEYLEKEAKDNKHSDHSPSGM